MGVKDALESNSIPDSMMKNCHEQNALIYYGRTVNLNTCFWLVHVSMPGFFENRKLEIEQLL